jgi:hypothetical protein
MASVLRSTSRLTVPSLRRAAIRPKLRATSRALATQTVCSIFTTQLLGSACH